jgi:hypothetical protein
MQVTLVISGLLDVSASTLASIDAGAPALARLLAAAGAPAVDDQGDIAVACDALGILRQQDWPVAPWLARNAGIARDAAYWLCAAPATLEVGRGDVRLAGTVTDLQPAETAALLSTLNAHFAENCVRFHAPDTTHWLAGCGAVQSLATQPPGHALGAPLLDRLPTGADGERWRSWQNEIQMLLFEHPVNVAREGAGRAVVNSVWFWGGGAPVAGDPRSRIAALYADAWLPRELARAARVACTAVPASLDALRDKSSQSPAAVWIDPPAASEPAQLANWLGRLERDWAVPARGAFHNGTIKGLDIVALGRSKTVRFTGRRLSLARRLRSWRSAPRLSTLLAPHLDA